MCSSALAVTQQPLSFCHHAPSKAFLSCPSKSVLWVQRWLPSTLRWWEWTKTADSFGINGMLKANLVSAARNRTWCALGLSVLWIKQSLIDTGWENTSVLAKILDMQVKSRQQYYKTQHMLGSSTHFFWQIRAEVGKDREGRRVAR